MKTETTRQIIGDKGDKEGEEVGPVRGGGSGRGREGTGYTAVVLNHARRCGGGEGGIKELWEWVAVHDSVCMPVWGGGGGVCV